MTRAWQVSSVLANPFLMGRQFDQEKLQGGISVNSTAAQLTTDTNPSKSGQGRPTSTGQARAQSEWGHPELYDIGSIMEQISHLGLT